MFLQNIVPPSFSALNSKTFLFLLFLYKLLLKSVFHSLKSGLKWGLLTSKWNLVLWYPYSDQVQGRGNSAQSARK